VAQSRLSNLFFAHGSAWLDAGLFLLRRSSQYLGAFPDDRFLRLLFGPDGKLTAWKRLVKLSFLFIFALSIQSVWVFNIPE
jgi:hypothetical protein